MFKFTLSLQLQLKTFLTYSTRFLIIPLLIAALYFEQITS